MSNLKKRPSISDENRSAASYKVWRFLSALFDGKPIIAIFGE
jgi:hypothetical protein